MALNKQTYALYTVIGAVLIDSIGFGIVIPVIPNLIAERASVPMDQAAALGGWLLVAFAIAQFIFGPIVGALSDRYGRRPVLLLSMTAFGLDYLLMAFAPNYGWLLVGRLISGMAGAIYGPANAYIADSVPAEDRARYFGLIGAAFGVGFILGPAIGGLLGGLGTKAPFMMAAGLALFNAALGFFIVPESLAPNLRRPFDLARANPLGTFRQLWSLAPIRGLVIAQFLWQMAHQVYPSSWSFVMTLKFDWTPAMIGLSLAYVGLTMTVAQAGLVGPLVKRWGQSNALQIGLIIGTIELIANGLSPVGWGVFVIMTFGTLECLVYPTINASLSASVPADSQGELQGGIAGIQSVTEILAPAIYGQTLSYFAGPLAPVSFPGAHFLLAAGFAALAFVAVRQHSGTNRPSVSASPA
jgi:DHA1 family tetracycline resistance protein-like MFS transporter